MSTPTVGTKTFMTRDFRSAFRIKSVVAVAVMSLAFLSLAVVSADARSGADDATTTTTFFSRLAFIMGYGPLERMSGGSSFNSSSSNPAPPVGGVCTSDECLHTTMEFNKAKEIFELGFAGLQKDIVSIKKTSDTFNMLVLTTHAWMESHGINPSDFNVGEVMYLAVRDTILGAIKRAACDMVILLVILPIIVVRFISSTNYIVSLLEIVLSLVMIYSYGWGGENVAAIILVFSAVFAASHLLCACVFCCTAAAKVMIRNKVQDVIKKSPFLSRVESCVEWWKSLGKPETATTLTGTLGSAPSYIKSAPRRPLATTATKMYPDISKRSNGGGDNDSRSSTPQPPGTTHEDMLQYIDRLTAERLAMTAAKAASKNASY